MKLLSRYLAVLLVMTMFAALLPVTAFAAENEDIEAAEAVQEAGSPVIGPIGIGGGIIAYISQSGELSLTAYQDADDPVLPKDFMTSWRESITSIKVDKYSATIHFPEDSSYLFSNFTNLKSIDFSGFDTSRVKNMRGMFLHCEKLKELDLSSFNTEEVIDMSYMFAFCGNLRKLNVHFTTPKVKYMDYMFYGLWRINRLDLSYFRISNVTQTEMMFGQMDNLLTMLCPLYCKTSANLPCTMYDYEKNTYSTLPKNMTYSMLLFCSLLLARGEFKDVTDVTTWYYDPVYWAVAKGVTSGMGEGTFQPMADLTRAQAVTFLYKLAGEPDVGGLPEINFGDVPKTAWYYKPVRWAVAKGITTGYGPGTFQPNTVCNRAMIVTFLMRYSQKISFTYVKPTTSSDFADVPANAWYKGAVDWAVENEITTGYGSGMFQPMSNCNRAMMVTFIKRMVEI